MQDIDTVDYFPPVEQLADILCQKTQTTNPEFFRVMVSYYLAKVASMMRCNIKTLDRGDIPVSMYALNLALSGHGKGHSTNIVEEQIIHKFKKQFLGYTFPEVTKRSLAKLATIRSMKTGNSPDFELEVTTNEFDNLGTLAFSFDSGTPAAVKQMRHMLLMSGAGSMNMEIDEIGSNLVGNTDVLTTYLELFDVGKIKPKLTKNTKENLRNEEIDGRTPTNMMLFGTPTKLLDGQKTEDDFYSMLETGYARRCIFGYSRKIDKSNNLTPDQVYNNLISGNADTYIKTFATKLYKLANPVNFGITLTMDKPVALLIIEYRLQCEKLAATYAEHEEVRQAETSHRYFKALKLAGAYAFIDGSPEILESHFMNAVKLVEDSGKAFKEILTRDKNYVRLAKYIAGVNKELTHADIQDDLPFYKGGEYHKRDLLNLAIAWGYKNNVIIKRTFTDDIEFFTGEALEETNLDELIISYSEHITEGYINSYISWDELDQLIQEPGYHWVNHHLLEETK